MTLFIYTGSDYLDDFFVLDTDPPVEWQCNYVLLAFALVVNCIIQYPLALFILILKPERIDEIYGPDSKGRRVLGCMYFAIAVVSTAVLTFWKHCNPLDLAVPLFMVQIAYKVVSAMVIEIQNPVIIANLGIVVLQLITLWTCGVFKETFWSKKTVH